MTDAEIIKALKQCFICGLCNGCPLEVDAGGTPCRKLGREILDLINRQKAEIERLETELKAMQSVNRFNKEEIKRLGRLGASATRRLIKARAEAIKEFAERLKPMYKMLCVDEGDWCNELDNLVKEMVGDA